MPVSEPVAATHACADGIPCFHGSDAICAVGQEFPELRFIIRKYFGCKGWW